MSNYQMPYYINNGIQNPFGYNYQPQMQQQMQPQMQKIQQPEPMYKQSPCIQGKSVDSIEVVKAMDIPLDGSISYFPLTDGSAIVTKQLQQDGTSKTLIYKLSENANIEKETANYITVEEFNKAMENNNKDEFKDELKILKRKMQELSEDIKDINEYINKRKDK